jgi:hypothetical protein
VDGVVFATSSECYHHLKNEACGIPTSNEVQRQETGGLLDHFLVHDDCQIITEVETEERVTKKRQSETFTAHFWHV